MKRRASRRGVLDVGTTICKVRSAAQYLLPAFGLLASSCAEPGPLPSSMLRSVPLSEAFDMQGTMELEQDSTDLISGLDEFVERRGGGFVIADALRPRIRSYGEDGQLEAAFGRFGTDDPWTFRVIGGLAETATGRIVLADGDRDRLVYLTADLSPDTIIKVPGSPWDVFSFGTDLILWMWTAPVNEAESQELPIFHRWAENRLLWSQYPYPYPLDEYPYWTSFADFFAVTAGDSVFVANSLEYPVAVYDRAGDSVGSLGTPSASFRSIPRLEPGALSNRPLDRFIASFDLLDRIDLVDNTHLVVTRAYLDPDMPYPPFRWLHSHVEVYDRHTGDKLYEDVPLPEGAQVLGGGRHLYLLLNRNDPPWRIAKLSVQEP